MSINPAQQLGNCASCEPTLEWNASHLKKINLHCQANSIWLFQNREIGQLSQNVNLQSDLEKLKTTFDNQKESKKRENYNVPSKAECEPSMLMQNFFSFVFQDCLQRYWNLASTSQTGSKNDNNNNKSPYFKIKIKTKSFRFYSLS